MANQRTVKERNIDFSNCKYWSEIYAVLKNELELPDWFGNNLDALWDCVTGIMYVPAEIRISRKVADNDLQDEVNDIIAVLQEAEQKYHQITVIVDEDRK